MKKTVILLLIVLAAVAMLAACAEEPAPVVTPESPAEEQAPAVEPVTLIATNCTSSRTSALGEALTYFAEKVPEYTDGSVLVEPYYAGELGNANACITGLMDGTIDFTVTGDSYYSSYVPELQVFELPYLFQNNEEVSAVLDGAPGEAIAAKFAGTGMKLLSFWDIGWRQMTNKVRPVQTVEDVKGIKIRTLTAKVQIAAWEAFGAVPTPIDKSELYAALQQGTVDAQENSLSLFIDDGFAEIQPYVSITNHVYTPAAFCVNENTWNSLTPEQQTGVMQALDEATLLMRNLSRQADIDGVEILEAAGCQVITDVDTSGFQEAAQSVYTVFTDEYGTEMLDLIYETLGR